jgi:hypothetical protein
MNLSFEGNQFYISVNEKNIECKKEQDLVDSVAVAICDELELEVDIRILGEANDYHYFNLISFDSFFISRQEIRDAYKLAKIEQKNKRGK